MQTIISAFDDRELAQRALDRLVELGLDRDDLHIESGHDRSTSTAAEANDDGFFHRVARFFSDLFGSDDAHDSGRYAEAVRRGSAVLVVDARDASEAERARTALEQLGGHIDLDERSAQWEREGWSASGSERPRVAPGETVEAESTRMPRVANAAMDDGARTPGRTGEGDAGREASVVPVVEEPVQGGKREVQRGGVRIIQRMTETPVREMLRLREERTQAVEDVVRRAAVDVEPLGQGASERMLERSEGHPTEPVPHASADASSPARSEPQRGDTAVDPEIVERSR